MPQRLVESIQVEGGRVNRIPLQESGNNVKVQEGQEFRISSAFEVPVWRLNERNKNNRVYGDNVAQKVVQENKTTVCLADHPKDEGSVWNIVAVAKNPKIREGKLWVEAYFVDPAMADKIERIVEAGGELGLSSSAYGEVDRDGYVMYEGFEIDRYFDLVLEPSYNVYIGKESQKINRSDYAESVTSAAMPSEVVNPPEDEDDEEEDENEKRKRRRYSSLEPSVEDLTIDNNDNRHGTSNKENSMSNLEKIHEANFRMNIKSLIEDAENKSSLVEQRNAYQHILGFMDTDIANDLQEDIQNRLAEVNKQIESYAEKGVQADQIQTEAEEVKTEKQKLEEQLETQRKVYESKLNALQQRYEKANETINSLQEQITEKDNEVLWATADRNGRVKAEDYINLMRAYKNLNERVEQLKKKISSLKSQRTKSKSVESQSTQEQFTEDLDAPPVARCRGPKRKKEDVRNRSTKMTEAHSKQSKEQESAVEESEAEQDDSIDLDFSNTNEVYAFYRERITEDARYKAYKDEILACKTLQEAQIKAMNVDLDAVPESETKGLDDSPKKVSENTQAQDEIDITELDSKKSADPILENTDDSFMKKMRRDGWV